MQLIYISNQWIYIWYLSYHTRNSQIINTQSIPFPNVSVEVVGGGRALFRWGDEVLAVIFAESREQKKRGRQALIAIPFR